MRSLVVVVLLTLTVSLPQSQQTPPIIGLDSYLTQQSHIDKDALNDTFTKLPSSILKHLSHSTYTQNTRSFPSLTIPISLHIRLIGPDFPPSATSSLSAYLTASLPSAHFHVISKGHAYGHKLAAKHELHLDVSRSHALYSELAEAVKNEITNTPSPLRSTLVSLDYKVVDRIVKRDFEKEKFRQGVYVYLLNLAGGSQGKGYAYSYSGTGGRESSAGFTDCLGSVWTGKERYVWIDLGAGPVDYGPAISGDGVLPRGEFHPFATLHGRPKSQKALMADLASLVWSAYTSLVVPSLRIPVSYESSLVVEFVHVYGFGSGRDKGGLDFKEVERVFMDEANNGGLLVGDQSLSFRSYEVDFDKCSICSFAVSKAMSSYTSRFLFENYTLIVSEFLDSKKLHHVLTESAEEFRRVSGMPEDDGGRVLPVYVFDLDLHVPLLLDRYHQSVAFKDMVIAVRTKNTQTVSEYNCNGRHVFIHTRELERPLVGSILQSMWGVSPTHLHWSTRHNSTLVDYTWSVGQTPFGPFSKSSSLSFVQMDAARRNVLLTSLNYSVVSATAVLETVSAHGGERNLLKGKRQVEFIQRWNLFKYKLEKAVSALSHFDFEMALYYLKSSDHDLFSLHSIVLHATEELEASLVCFKDPPFPWASASMSVVAFSSLFYAYAKRDKLLRNKRKQF